MSRFDSPREKLGIATVECVLDTFKNFFTRPVVMEMCLGALANLSAGGVLMNKLIINRHIEFFVLLPK